MLDKAVARQIGVSGDVLLVSGGHDQACAALGSGVIRPGLAMVSTGTAEVVEVALASPALNETLYHGNISVYAHVVSGLFLSMTLNHSGGLLLRWFRDTLCLEELGQAKALNRDAYDLILAGADPQPSGLLVLPHFAGSGTPTFDTQSKGAIVGLTFAATKSDLAKAILEGLCYELRLNLDLLRKGGVGIEELRAIGGGARSALWLQLKADISGIEVAQPRLTEAASWGAALLAGEGAGIFPSAAQQAATSVILEGRYTPDPQRAARYNKLYDQYSQLYVRLAPILHAL
jgi:xylulokinase